MSSASLEFVRSICQHQPSLVVLVLVAFALFLFLVIDTHQFRKERGKHGAKS